MRWRPTNREIEVKLRVTDLPAMLRRLRRLAKLSRGRVFEQNTLYDTRDSAIRRAGYLLRLRLITPAPASKPRCAPIGAILTVKAPIALSAKTPRGRYKERLERETIVRDPRRWNARMRALGLLPSFCYEKYRTTFRLPHLNLDLDETPVGVFLELEGKPAAIDRAARALGFAPRDYIRGTYWDVYAADCRRRGWPIENMVFTS